MSTYSVNISKSEVEAILKYINETDEDIVALHITDAQFANIFHVSKTGRDFNKDKKNITDYSTW